MKDSVPEFSFRGLPLSAEQESEIQHYIHQRERRGLQPDVEELRAMVHDMLAPPLARTQVSEPKRKAHMPTPNAQPAWSITAATRSPRAKNVRLPMRPKR
ncbi:hypothetical protein ACN9MU_21395 [Pseudoduganella sp. R-32]|uniref:hypothetical protein n=1 Tax=Pseudoduganella sp. R-32 TaxID=3404061 RepID=UPI003CEB998A